MLYQLLPDGKIIKFQNALYQSEKIITQSDIPAWGFWTVNSRTEQLHLGFKPSFVILSSLTHLQTTNAISFGFIGSDDNVSYIGTLATESSMNINMKIKYVRITFMDYGIRANNLGLNSETFPIIYWYLAFR